MAGDPQALWQRGSWKREHSRSSAPGHHYSNLLQKNSCQWFTSKLQVQTLPQCCKTNSPHRCTLLQAALLHKETEAKETKAYASTSLLYLRFMVKKYSKIVWNPSLKPNKAHPKNLDEKGGWWPDSIIHSKTLIKLIFKHILVKADHQTMLIRRTNTAVVLNSRILQHYN